MIRIFLKEDIWFKVSFILASLSVLVFTVIILASLYFCEKPNMLNGFVVPVRYSINIVYFPAADELFAKSLVNFLKENNLEVHGMASKNSLWTKGYIVYVSPIKK